MLDKVKDTDALKICVSCGAPFRITKEAGQFYVSHKLKAPKRCMRCREERKRKEGVKR